MVIRCDNGPEFISHEFADWALKNEIRIEYIQLGNPQQNAYIERHNRTIKYSWVSKHLFETLDEVQDYATLPSGHTQSDLYDQRDRVSQQRYP